MIQEKFKTTSVFQFELQLVAGLCSLIWEKCYWCDTWIVTCGMLLLRVCLHMCLIALYVLWRYCYYCNPSCRRFVNMLSWETYVTIIVWISCKWLWYRQIQADKENQKRMVARHPLTWYNIGKISRWIKDCFSNVITTEIHFFNNSLFSKKVVNFIALTLTMCVQVIQGVFVFLQTPPHSSKNLSWEIAATAKSMLTFHLSRDTSFLGPIFIVCVWNSDGGNRVVAVQWQDVAWSDPAEGVNASHVYIEGSLLCVQSVGVSLFQMDWEDKCLSRIQLLFLNLACTKDIEPCILSQNTVYILSSLSNILNIHNITK